MLNVCVRKENVSVRCEEENLCEINKLCARVCWRVIVCACMCVYLNCNSIWHQFWNSLDLLLNSICSSGIHKIRILYQFQTHLIYPNNGVGTQWSNSISKPYNWGSQTHPNYIVISMLLQLIGGDLDGARKEQQIIKAKLKQLDDEKEAIEKQINALQEELTIVTEKRDKAFEKIQELRKQREEGVC